MGDHTENHRMVRVGRDLWRSSRKPEPTPWEKGVLVGFWRMFFVFQTQLGGR